MAKPIELTAEQLSTFAGYLSQVVDASAQVPADLSERWDEVDDMASNRLRESLKRPWPGAPVYQIPVVRPKLQQNTAFVCQPLTKQDPYFMVRAGGESSKRCDEIERHSHMALQLAKYSARTRQIVDVTQRRGNSWVYPCWFKPKGKRRKPIVRLDVLDPQDIVAYPSSATCVDDMLAVGHQSKMTVRQVNALVESGDYYEHAKDIAGDGLAATPGAESDSALQNTSDNSVAKADEPLTVYNLQVWCDPDESGTERIVSVHYAKHANKILGVYKYPYSKFSYFICAMHEEYGKIYNENSRGHDLAGMQYYTNDIHAQIVWGSQRASFPVVFADDWALPSERMNPAPGEIVSLQKGGQAFSPQSRVDLAAFPMLLQYADNTSDKVSKLSANGVGGNLRAGTTATEASQVAAGQATGVDEDAMNIGFGLSEICEFIVNDLLFVHYSEWIKAYGESLPPVEKSAFDRTYIFEPNGETPINTPAAVAQQAQMLVNMVTALPELAAEFPDMVKNLFRSVVQSTQLNNKDSIMPSPEEEMAGLEDEEGNQGVIDPTMFDPRMAAFGGDMGEGTGELPEDIDEGGLGLPPELLDALGSGAGPGPAPGNPY